MFNYKIGNHNILQGLLNLIVTIVMIQSETSFAQTDGLKVAHEIVFSEDGKYGGWPANHGIWTWDNEILIGFVKASYTLKKLGLHTYDISTSKNKYARSLDGGVTWKIADAVSY